MNESEEFVRHGGLGVALRTRITSAMYQNSVWKGLLGAVVLLVFAIIGVAHVLYPDRFAKPHLRDRTDIRLGGLIFATFSVYLLYDLLRDMFSR
jgi:uncharacterized membrane protein